MTETQPDAVLTMDKLTALCKRRGFIYPSCELYGGLNGFFDYGPLGVELKNNIKAAWWEDVVRRRNDVVGLDSSILSHKAVWKASGHLDNFSDPMVDCKVSKMRYRADQLFFAPVQTENGDCLGYVSVLEGPEMAAQAQEAAHKLFRKKPGSPLLPLVLKPYTQATADEYAQIPSPETGQPGSLTPPREFNLMFQTYVGALREEGSEAYLRPETAQGIFINFKNVVDTTRVKIPFGIAQIGKAFRNEITPRNYIFRSREFEQMELEYFIEGDEQLWPRYHQMWVEERLRWHQSIGLKPEWLSLDVHPKNKLAHYARACTDICFQFPFGVQELEGVAARGNFDLSQHQTASGKTLEYFNAEEKARFVPHVIEPSVGVERTLLAVLCSAYHEETVEGELRVVLKLHPRLAPIKVAVLPLVKNKPELVEKAQAVFKRLQKRWNVFYDDSGAIGRRYRRMDEVGTPFAVTVDFESLDDHAVTVRERDSTRQERIPEAELLAYLEERLNG